MKTQLKQYDEKFDAKRFAEPFANRRYDNLIYEWHEAQKIQDVALAMAKAKLSEHQRLAVYSVLGYSSLEAVHQAIQEGYQAVSEAQQEMYGEEGD